MCSKVTRRSLVVAVRSTADRGCRRPRLSANQQHASLRAVATRQCPSFHLLHTLQLFAGRIAALLLSVSCSLLLRHFSLVDYGITLDPVTVDQISSGVQCAPATALSAPQATMSFIALDSAATAAPNSWQVCPGGYNP